MFTCDDPAVLVVATKPADDGNGIIVRVRECDGEARRVDLRCGGRMRSASAADACERPLAGEVAVDGELAELRVTRLRLAHVPRPSMTVRTRTIDTVLFDLDDTLLDDSRAYKEAARRVAEEVAAERGIDAERLFTSYVAQANGFWKKLSAEHLTLPIHDARAQLWSDALVAAGVPVDVALAERCGERYTRYRADGLTLFPGALDVILALRERGCKLGIVTNGFAATHNEKVDRVGLRPLRRRAVSRRRDGHGQTRSGDLPARLPDARQRTGPHRDGRRPLRPRHHRRRRRSACSRS